MTWQTRPFLTYIPHIVVAAFLLYVYIGIMMPKGEVPMAVMAMVYACITVPMYGMTLAVMRTSRPLVHLMIIVAGIGALCNFIALYHAQRSGAIYLTTGGAIASLMILWFCLGKLKTRKGDANRVTGTT